MGKKKRYNNRFRKRNKDAVNQKTRTGRSDRYHDLSRLLVRQKHVFAFYNKLLEDTFEDEAEMRRFNESLRTSLPTSFRINHAGSNHSKVIQRILEEQEQSAKELEIFLKQYDSIPSHLFKLKQIPWYPGRPVWVMDATRNLLKKCIPLKKLHRFIQRGSDGGLLTRQELVSMLPPLYLDIQPDDKVLDMCAAPGSKTSQLLEKLLMGCSDQQVKGTSLKDRLRALGMSKGAIIANELDARRAFILSRQMKRFNSSNVAVINHPGQGIPTIWESEKGGSRFFFDKVLVDVPCSGDGAIRKIPVKWKTWRFIEGVNLHYLQIHLLEKAVDLVKKGGLVVYSTCSLNPVENEAVVAEVIRRANAQVPGALELEDIHSRFEGLKMRKGMTKWQFLIERSKKEQALLRKSSKSEKDKISENEEKEETIEEEKPEAEIKVPAPVFDKKTRPDLERFVYVNGMPKEKEFEPVPFEPYFKCYDSYEEYCEAYKDLNPSEKIKPSLFYQNQGYLKDTIQIEKTGRIHPHDQNTGGFYLALIRKREDVQLTSNIAKSNTNEVQEKKEEEIKEEIKEEEEIAEVKEIEEVKEEKHGEFKKPNMVVRARSILKDQDLMNYTPILEEEWEQIREEFQLAEDFPKHLLVCSSNKQARRINFINQGLHDLLSIPANAKLRKIYFGVSAFSRNYGKTTKNKAAFRLSYAGLPLVYPYLTQNIIDITFAEFSFLLERPSSLPFETVRKCPSLWAKLEPLRLSSFCLKMELETSAEFEEGTEFLVLQKMPDSTGIMVSRENLDALRTKYSIDLLPEVTEEKAPAEKK